MITYLRKKLIWVAGIFIACLLVIFTITSFFAFNPWNFIIILGISTISIVVFWVYKYQMQAKKIVIITNKISLISPPGLFKSVITYKLKMVTEHKFEEKGEFKEVKIDELELSFNKNDHPDIYNYCLRIIHERIENSKDLAEIMYPNAKIISASIQLPNEIKQLTP